MLLLINLLSPGWEIVKEEVLLGRVLAVRWREGRTTGTALHLSPQLLHQLGVALLHLLGELLSGLTFENISITMKLPTNRAESKTQLRVGR